MVNDATVWTIVHAAITGFMVLPIVMVGILSLVLARRRRDPARRAFSWLKGCHPLLLVSISCIISADVLNVILYSWQNDAGYYDTVNHTRDDISAIIRSERYLSFAGNLFEHSVDIFFVLILVELGNGLMYTLEGQSRPYQLRLRYAAYVTIIVLICIVLAYFGQPASAWVAYWNSSENNASYVQLTQSLKVVSKIGASFYIPSWAVSICQIVYASFVVYKHKAGVATRQVALLYLIITILDFVRWTLFVVLYARWILPSADNPWWWNLVDALGNTWLRFMQLVLLLIIGMRRRKGIWTTQQAWTPSNLSTMVSEMDSAEAGPSPVGPPSTGYSHATWPRKENSAPPMTQQSWCTPQPTPAWPHGEVSAAPPLSMTVAPQELDAMQYQYAPHPLLGPGYLVLQSPAQIQQLQQLFQHQQLQQLQQQQPQQLLLQLQQSPQPPQAQPPGQQTLPALQTQLQHAHSFHAQQHPLDHQPSFQYQHHHTQ
ncbi:hypothetical protein E4U21_003342 [Claviceps maximensis]|nr:hypothetical protein E4U21_003342 [Claviceps maximensis]